MAEALLSLLIAICTFGFGCFLVYQLLKDRQKWDDFWETQSRHNFLAPQNWPGSNLSKLISYLFPFVMLIGGFIALVSTAFNLTKMLN